MRPGELLLRYEALNQRAGGLEQEIERLEGQLARNPEVERLNEAQAEIRAEQESLAARLRQAERLAEDHRSRMRERDRELMSGRIRNPTDLTKLSEEVEHLKARVGLEEDAELVLMEEMEAVERRLAAAGAALEAAQALDAKAAPGVRERLQTARADLASAEADRDQIWAEVPADYQAEYRRIRVRPAVAEVSNGSCTACHVRVTSSGLQLLRRGDRFVHCDNCGRLLVAV